MKRYTVKEVVRLENKVEQLTDIKDQRLDELYSFPLSILTAIGVVLTMGYFKEGMETTLPLILGSSSVLFGGSSLTYLFSASQIRGKLREKLNKIYDIMGEDFKTDVKIEKFKQKYEISDEHVLGSRSDEEKDKFFGGRQR